MVGWDGQLREMDEGCTSMTDQCLVVRAESKLVSMTGQNEAFHGQIPSLPIYELHPGSAHMCVFVCLCVCVC